MGSEQRNNLQINHELHKWQLIYGRGEDCLALRDFGMGNLRRRADTQVPTKYIICRDKHPSKTMGRHYSKFPIRYSLFGERAFHLLGDVAINFLIIYIITGAILNGSENISAADLPYQFFSFHYGHTAKIMLQENICNWK